MDATDSKTPRSGGLAPDHHELYVLALGILLGVLLGPAVLGRFAPSAYDRLWVGSGPAAHEIDELTARFETNSRKFDQETADQLDRLRATGVTDVAIHEKEMDRLNEKARAINDYQQQRLQLEGQLSLSREQREQQLWGHLLALILATLALMVVEALIDPRKRPVLRSRLASLRYVLLALGLAVLLAQPALLRPVPRLFTVGLVGVALLLALAPIPGLVKRGED